MSNEEALKLKPLIDEVFYFTDERIKMVGLVTGISINRFGHTVVNALYERDYTNFPRKFHCSYLTKVK